tara:strand:- start:1628 stop:1816 length:189 start_codon:yes stop_codon:yes gene_type:complete
MKFKVGDLYVLKNKFTSGDILSSYLFVTSEDECFIMRVGPGGITRMKYYSGDIIEHCWAKIA